MARLGAAHRRATTAEKFRAAAAKAAKVGSDASSEGRSRSRSPARQPRAQRARGPQLRDWVLVRKSSRFWCDAVPALVSKVTTGLAEEDATVSLVLPNRLALRHGFGSPKPFLVLEGVALRDVRPYIGADQAWLRSVLLRAIKEYRGVAREPREARPALYAVPEPPMPMEQETEEQQLDSEEGARGSRCGALPGVQEVAREVGEQRPESEEPSEAAELPEVAPTTPLPSGERRLKRLRPLARCESLPKEAAAPAPAAAVAAGDCKPVAAAAAATAAGAGEPAKRSLAAARRAELTAAVAWAFRSREALELSRQELEETLGEAAGAEELAETLQALDTQNKLFVSGDLVFLI